MQLHLQSGRHGLQTASRLVTGWLMPGSTLALPAVLSGQRGPAIPATVTLAFSRFMSSDKVPLYCRLVQR